MKKQEIKNILISMRTQENETWVNNLLGKIDMLDEQFLKAALDKVGNTEAGVKKIFEDKLRKQNLSEEKFPINDMFTYGISENCIHLHLPEQLHENIAEHGLAQTIDLVNLYLIDAIDKINRLKSEGFYRFKGAVNIYMISPIVIKRELRFLEELDFKTNLYRKKDLRYEEFLDKNPEAKFATHIFGKDRNVGTASISINTIRTEEWQAKKKEKVKEITEKGVTLQKEVEIEE